MRRITFTLMVTAAILVLLFSYRTSTQGPTVTAASSTAAHIVSRATAQTTTTTSAPPDPTANTSTPQQITEPAKSSAATTTSAKRKATTSSRSATTAQAASTKAAPATTAAPTSTTTKNMVVDGAPEMTQYGAVQVEVTISGNKISNVQAIQYPNQDPRDQEINSNAIPQLQDEVISAQSARIDGVSGATYTSEGFISSLQSALDAANFR